MEAAPGCLRLGQRLRESRWIDGSLPAVPPLSARLFPAADEGRGVLCTRVVGKWRRRLGVPLHPVLLRHRQLVGGGAENRRPGNEGRLARHTSRPAIRYRGGRGGLWL